MKLIITDFLRRWWGAYLAAVFFVGLIDVMWTTHATEAHGSFMFMAFFMLPLVFDWKRGHTGVIATLPVQRRTIAHYYWGLAVALPVLCVTITFVIAGVVSACFFSAPPIATLMAGFGAIVPASLVMAGAAGSIMTAFPPLAPEETNRFSVSWMLLWFPSIAVGLPGLNLFQITKQSPMVWLAAGIVGIFLCSWSFRRAEKLVIAPARTRLDQTNSSRKEPERIPPFDPGRAGFGATFFFEVARNSFLMGLLFLGLFLVLPVFKNRLGANTFILPWMFAFCTLGSLRILAGGARMLRSLPLSVGRLAFILLLLPLCSLLGVTFAVAALGIVYPGHLFGPHPASFLIPMTGAVCLASSLFLPLGAQSGRFVVLPLAVLASSVILGKVEDAGWPAAFWWLLGFSLTVAAFFLNRRWLHHSCSYRPSTGDLVRVQR